MCNYDVAVQITGVERVVETYKNIRIVDHRLDKPVLIDYEITGEELKVLSANRKTSVMERAYLHLILSKRHKNIHFGTWGLK